MKLIARNQHTNAVVESTNESQSDAERLGGSPEKGDEIVSPAPPADRPRFRRSVIPATLLWTFSPLQLIILLFMVGMATFVNVRYRWIAPDPEFLQYFNRDFLSPPVVACVVFGIISAVCGITAALAWTRGNKRRAIGFTIAYLVVLALASYVGPENL